MTFKEDAVLVLFSDFDFLFVGGRNEYPLVMLKLSLLQWMAKNQNAKACTYRYAPSFSLQYLLFCSSSRGMADNFVQECELNGMDSEHHKRLKTTTAITTNAHCDRSRAKSGHESNRKRKEKAQILSPISSLCSPSFPCAHSRSFFSLFFRFSPTTTLLKSLVHVNLSPFLALTVSL